MGMMNLIVAALCNAMNIVRESEEQQKDKGKDVEDNIDILKKQVHNLNQSVTEVIGYFENEKMIEYLENKETFANLGVETEGNVCRRNRYHSLVVRSFKLLSVK